MTNPTILSSATVIRDLADSVLNPYRYNLNGARECDLCSKPSAVTVYSNGCKYHYCYDCNDKRLEDDTAGWWDSYKEDEEKERGL